MKCIYCGENAEYIVGGQSCCKKHILNPEMDVPCYEDFKKYVKDTFGKTSEVEE